MIAAEGAIAICRADDAKQAAIVEVNCETDFVAKDEQFQTFSNQLARLTASKIFTSIDELNAASMDTGQTVYGRCTGLAVLSSLSEA